MIRLTVSSNPYLFGGEGNVKILNSKGSKGSNKDVIILIIKNKIYDVKRGSHLSISVNNIYS